MEVHSTERGLLEACVDAVRALDPDILIGFDVQKARNLPSPDAQIMGDVRAKFEAWGHFFSAIMLLEP